MLINRKFKIRLLYVLFCITSVILTLFRMGRQKAPPPTSFFPVTSTNVGFGLKNFLTFSFNPVASLEEKFQVCT